MKRKKKRGAKPTDLGRIFCVRLSRQQEKHIDRMAARSDCGASTLIRTALWEWLRINSPNYSEYRCEYNEASS